MKQSLIQNPELEGDSFSWEGGPTGVLLIHGFTATTAEVRPLAQALQANGYAISAPLLPGHHAQPRDLNRVRWRDWVRTVEGAYRDLAARCQRVVVGGESMGGLLALYLAGEHPEVAAVLTYAPALRLARSRLDNAVLYLCAPFLPYVAKRSAKRPAITDADRLWQGYTVNPLRGAIELRRLQGIVRPMLKQIRQPILIVQGRLDQTVSAIVPEWVRDSVRSTVRELHWMEHSSHCVILDDERAEVQRLTLEFLRRALNGKEAS